MEGLQLPNETFQYAFAAHEEARKSAIAANYGNRAKTIFFMDEGILNKWRDLMINASVLFYNALFFLFVIVDIIISWEMLRDIVSNAVSLPSGWETFSILMFCLLINGWAAVTAHFIGRGWSKQVHDFERWNYIFIKNRSQSPQNIVSSIMQRETRLARWMAVLSGLILIGLVGVIIYYRIALLDGETSSVNPDDELEGDIPVAIPGLNIIMTYLPLAIIIGEIFTGGYLWYSVRVLQKRWSRYINRRKYLKFKENCGKSDQLAVQYTQAAQQNEEVIEITGDLERAHLRFKYRSQQNDDYLDPLDNFKRIAFNIKYQGTGKPVANVKVFGVLPNSGTKTGDYRTDEDGRVVIPMNNGHDHLVAIYVQNKEYLGPFQSYGEHYIDLPEYVTSNGVM